MDTGGVRLVVEALKRYDDRKKRMEYLISSLKTGELANHEGLLLGNIISEVYDGSAFGLVSDARLSAGELELGKQESIYEFFELLVSKLENVLRLGKALGAVESADYFIEIKYLYGLICSSPLSNGVGEANQLVRRFGAICDEEFLEREVTGFQKASATKVIKAFYRALSDGYTSRNDSTEVAKAHIRMRRGNLKNAPKTKFGEEPQTISLPEAQQRLRNAAASCIQNNKKSVERVELLFGNLQRMPGGSRKMAVDIVEAVKPGLLGDFATDYCDKPVGGHGLK